MLAIIKRIRLIVTTHGYATGATVPDAECLIAQFLGDSLLSNSRTLQGPRSTLTATLETRQQDTS